MKRARKGYQTREQVRNGLAGLFYLWTLFAVFCVGVSFLASDRGVQAWGLVGAIVFIILMNSVNAAGHIAKALMLPPHTGEGE